MSRCFKKLNSILEKYKSAAGVDEEALRNDIEYLNRNMQKNFIHLTPSEQFAYLKRLNELTNLYNEIFLEKPVSETFYRVCLEDIYTINIKYMKEVTKETHGMTLIETKEDTKKYPIYAIFDGKELKEALTDIKVLEGYGERLEPALYYRWIKPVSKEEVETFFDELSKDTTHAYNYRCVLKNKSKEKVKNTIVNFRSY